ncbi:unnamed protein product [Acanthosepion pharaonis]|uniref:PLD phosphodiesterase domain-containing protein n=1 Tax=Acanthosepion pharaonis TaxID=158019 RepID=A0A812BVR1_ACAPH|nr:unnamed protein product [Sepia pharaonis]
MTSRKAVEKNQTTMADSTLPLQYEAVFILANEGLDSYCEYVESNEITFFLNDEEERYFQDQGRISSSERKEFILKTSRLVNKKPGPASSSGGEDQGSGDNSDNVDASSTTTTTEDKTDNISKEDALDSTDASNVVGMDMSGDYTLFTKQPVYVLFQPPLYDGLPHIQDLICESILNARSNIRISMFVFTDVFIYNSLCQATTTGAVTIDILLDATQVEQFLKMLGKNCLNVPDGLNICLNSGTGPYQRNTGATMGLAHEKFLICDEDKAIFGSYNYTWSAANINRENVVVVSGKQHPIIRSLLQQFNKMQETCILFETD